MKTSEHKVFYDAIKIIEGLLLWKKGRENLLTRSRWLAESDIENIRKINSDINQYYRDRIK
ncbi:hypothetical protein GCWU000341_02156 [Oribacterium sp. oral taxon 078 str. F0262]|nr:hypothetical protein GCWU000341_02156 [Oribacterium sp. oral taxon 078 str. F0262]